MKHRIALAGIALISLLGCTSPSKTASDPGICLQKHSEGWCLLEVAGLSDGARDIQSDRKRDVNLNLQALLDQRPGEVGGVNLALAGLEALSPTRMPGLPASGPGAFFLFTAFAGTNKPGSMPNLFAIVPNASVVGANPLATVESHVLRTTASYLGATVSQRPMVFDKKHLIGSSTTRMFQMFGGRCGGDGCYAFTPFSYSQDSKKNAFKTVALPYFLGSGPGHVVLDAGPVVFKTLEKPYTSNILKHAEYVQIIAKLPNWFYLYNPGTPAFVISNDKLRLLTIGK